MNKFYLNSVKNTILVSKPSTSIRLLLMVLFVCSFANATNYYSKSTGNLNTPATWGTNTDGSGTAPGNFTTAGNVFFIRNNTTPTVAANWAVSGLGSKIVLGDGVTGINFTVGSNYVVTANMDILAQGTLTLTTTGTTAITFGTLALSSTVNYAESGNQTVFVATYGNLTLSGSGTKAAAGNITVNNDFTLTAGTFRLNNATSYSLTIMGNYLQTGGKFDFNSGTSGSSTMNLSGNLTNTSTSSSSLTTSGTGAPNGNIVFNGAGLRVLNIPTSGAADWVKYIVNVGSTVKMINNFTLSSANLTSQYIYIGELIVNGTIDCGIYQITQSGGIAGVAQVTINSGATLITANANGIDGSVSSTNVTRNFNTGANYVFNGTATQVTSAGLPATVNSLTINNTAGVTLGKATTITNNFSITTGSKANLGTFNHTAGTLTLGGATTPLGSWGSSSSSATNISDTYFSATTGIVTVSTATCTAPSSQTMTGAGGPFCGTSTGSSIGLANSQTGVSYRLLRGSIAVGSPVAGTGSAISFGTFNTTGTYTVLATKTTTFCTATMSGSVKILNYSTPPTLIATVVNVSCPTDATGTINITNPVAPASLAFVSASNQYIDFGTPLLSNRAQFTVEGWVKFDPANYVTRMALFGQNDAIEIAFESNNLRCWTAGGGQVDLSLASFPAGNAWHHIAVTGNGTNLKIYLDGGTPVTGGSATSNYGSSSDSAKIGYGVMDPLGSGVGLTGEVFKLGFWNRALTATEINDMASGFVVYDASQSGLLAGYSFNEAIGGASTVSGVGAVAPTGNFVNSPLRKDPYVYSWTSVPPGFTSSSKNLTGLTARTYNLATSLKGCTSTGSWVVNSTNTAPLTPTVTLTQPTCTLATGTITVNTPTPATGISYTITGPSPATTTVTNSTGIFSGLAAGTYSVTSTNPCGTSTATSVTLAVVTNKWTVTAGIGSWSAGTPTSNQAIEFAGDYSVATDVSACSCTVTSGIVTIPTSNNLILAGKLTVNALGTLTFENNASLVQTTFTGANSGEINYKRKYTGGQMDYTYWSSPVASQNLLLFSPTTKSDKFFSFDPATDNWLQEDPSTTAMIVGKGYIIRGIPPPPGPPPGLDTAIFKGEPNNGNIPIVVVGGEKSYLIGNPYPSAIDADAFITANSAAIDGTLYFWTHNTPIAIGTPDPGTGVWAYSGNDYATYTLAGGVATKVGNITLDVEWVDADNDRKVDTGEFTDKNGNGTLDKGEWIDSNSNGTLETGEWIDANNNNIAENSERTDIDNDGVFETGEWEDLNGDYILNLEVDQISNRPTGKIAAGQSFFTTSTTAGGPVNFTNAMRVDGLGNPLNNSKFYKTKNPKAKTTNTIEKNRVWLNLTNTQGAFKQTLVGYITGATNTWDNLYDGESFDGNDFLDFYSINQDMNLTIQGRALPFDENDEIPLGYRIAVDGNFTISIDETDGLLADQPVYIEDKLTNTIFDLKAGNYTFKTAAGTFNDRFVLRYTSKTLGTSDFDVANNKIIVSVKNKQIKINSFVETIDKVAIYDESGRQIYQRDKVNSNELLIPNFVSSHQILIVKTSLQNGKTVTNKLIY